MMMNMYAKQGFEPGDRGHLAQLWAWARRLVLVCMAAMFLAFGALAQQVDSAPVDAQLEALQQIAAQIPDASEEELLALREEVRAVRQEADTVAAPWRTRAAELRNDLDRLGPKPEDGTNEAPDIETRRRILQEEFDRLDSVIRQTELNIIEASRLLSDISARRSRAFYGRVLGRDDAPFTLSSGQAALEALEGDRQTLVSRYTDWRATFQTDSDFNWTIFYILLSLLIAGVLLWPVPRRVDQSLLHQFRDYDATPARRVTLAAIRVVTRAVPALIAATVIYQMASWVGVVTDDSSRLAGSILLALGTIFVVDDVANAVFAPHEPKWRLVPLESQRARGVRFLLVSIVIIFSANAVSIRIFEWLGSPRELVTVVSAFISVIGGIFIFILARPQLWRMREGHEGDFSADTRKFWRWVRTFAALAAVLSICAVLFGYIALGRFVLSRIYYLSFLFIAGWFTRALLVELAERVANSVTHSVDGNDQSKETEQREYTRLMVFWLSLLIDVAVMAAMLPLALLVIGVAWADMKTWVFDALFGIEVGGFTISLAKVFSAFAAVFIIMVITRFIQRTSDARIFAPARMEGGLRNTFRTLIGYTGLVIGIMVGIGMLGFPLANLALVAGALSLGIGFGLQSIVNNFVSGLILLFERPIKVGDWIITSAGEGIVKRISVRSTEIETFDWASVIVPNSELISAPVTNWTHKNRYTRLSVAIGVSYNSDPEEVSAILMKVAKANRRTLSYPAPVIYFSGYGDSSLDFQVRIFINNVDDRIPVQNELRVAIFKAFKEASIEIPFPQRDLHVRTLVPGMVMAGEPVPAHVEEVVTGEGPVAPEPTAAPDQDAGDGARKPETENTEP